MSFILDALKKSETDRQRQTSPALFEVKVAAPRRRLPIWGIAVGALLAVNIAFLIWYGLRSPAAPAPISSSPARTVSPGWNNPLAARVSLVKLQPSPVIVAMELSSILPRSVWIVGFNSKF